MKIATYNVNGVKGRMPLLLEWLEEARPDIACLQEIKTGDAPFPHEPIEAAGIRVVGVDELTGLAEYRNGGLFVDADVLVPKHDAVTKIAHAPGSEIVVEWRALTIALLDRVTASLRTRFGKDATTLPVARVLEGGTWAAGREIASEKRPGGGPPITIASDGTVF